MKSFHFALAALLVFAASAQANSERYFTFIAKDRAQLSTITKMLSIDKVTRQAEGSELLVHAYADDREFANFKKLGIPFQLQAKPGDKPVTMLDASEPELNNFRFGRPARINYAWNAYPTFDTYEKMMAQFASDHPELCQVSSIGKSIKGRGLWMARITGNKPTTESKPEVYFSSTMHGDETTGYVLMLRLIDYLLEGYGRDARLTNLMDHLVIWINPLANPDGTYRSGNNTVSGATRYNSSYVDLNRNFPDPKVGDHPDGKQWQPENVAQMKFTENRGITLSANFHGGAEVVNYPWDTWQKRHADDSWFVKIARAYADLVHTFAPTYMKELNNGVTNGFDWYEVNGGRQDFMTYFRRMREITLEVSSVKLADASKLPMYWDYNRDPLLSYMEEALNGIQGFVSDATSKAPLNARIEVIGHDADNSDVFTRPGSGQFTRLLTPGDYRLRVSADGYKPVETQVLTVKDKTQTPVTVELQKL